MLLRSAKEINLEIEVLTCRIHSLNRDGDVVTANQQVNAKSALLQVANGKASLAYDPQDPPLDLLNAILQKVQLCETLGPNCRTYKTFEHIRQKLVVDGKRLGLGPSGRVDWASDSYGVRDLILCYALGIKAHKRELFKGLREPLQAFRTFDADEFVERSWLDHSKYVREAEKAERVRGVRHEEGAVSYPVKRILPAAWATYSRVFSKIDIELDKIAARAYENGEIVCFDESDGFPKLVSEGDGPDNCFVSSSRGYWFCLTSDLPFEWFYDHAGLARNKQRAAEELRRVALGIERLGKRANQDNLVEFLRRRCSLSENAAKEVVKDTAYKNKATRGRIPADQQISLSEIMIL